MIVLGANYGGRAPRGGPLTVKTMEVSTPPWGAAASIAAAAQTRGREPPPSRTDSSLARIPRQAEPPPSVPLGTWRRDGIGRPKAV